MKNLKSLFGPKAEDRDPTEEEIIASIGKDIPAWGNFAERHFTSIRMRLDRVHNIQRFVLHHGKAIENRAGRKLFLSSEFEDQQKVAKKILRTLQFSPRLTTMILNMVEKTVEDIQLDHGPNFLPAFQTMSLKQKYPILKNVLETFISHVADFIPDPKMPELHLGLSAHGLSDWMNMSKESLYIGDFGGVYLNRRNIKGASFPNLVGRIIHEATHIALAQIASAHAFGDIRLRPEIVRDMTIIIESIKLEFIANSLAEEIYRNDPQEVIAFAAQHHATNNLLSYYLGQPKEPRHFITPDDIVLPMPASRQSGINSRSCSP